MLCLVTHKLFFYFIIILILSCALWNKIMYLREKKYTLKLKKSSLYEE